MRMIEEETFSHRTNRRHATEQHARDNSLYGRFGDETICQSFSLHFFGIGYGLDGLADGTLEMSRAKLLLRKN